MTEFHFKGKEFVYNHHLAVPFRPLVTHPEKGIGEPSLDGNRREDPQLPLRLTSMRPERRYA